MKGGLFFMHGGTALKQGMLRKEAESFVSLRLMTADQVPLLADDDLAQAAEIALISFIRMHRCHVLAVGRFPNYLHLIIKFPASLSPKELAGMVRAKSAEAVANFLSMEHQRRFYPDMIWGRKCQIETLSPADVPAAIADVCSPMTPTHTMPLAWDHFL